MAPEKPPSTARILSAQFHFFLFLHWVVVSNMFAFSDLPGMLQKIGSVLKHPPKYQSKLGWSMEYFCL